MKEEDYKKALHILKSLTGHYRKRGLAPQEVREALKKHITDVLYYQTIYSSNKRIKTAKPSPYYAALQILE